MAIQNIVDFIVKAKVVGAGKVKTDVNTMASSVEDGGKRVDKVLRGQAKLTRRLAAQNKKAFTLAAVGMGPLIRGYANIAASIFAVSAAWDAVGIGAKFEQTNTAFAQLTAGLGLNSKVIIADLKDLSANAVTTQLLMENAALALSAGISVKQLEGLTLVARKAARVMGRTLPDAYNRLIKGVTKLEPELIDELGLTFKLGPALIKYARATGQAVTSVTQLEKVQISAKGVLAESDSQYKDIIITTATYSERLDALKSGLIDFASKTASKATPAIVILSETIANHITQVGILLGAYAFLRIATSVRSSILGKEAAAEANVMSLERQRVAVLLEQTAATEALATAEATRNRTSIRAATVRLSEVKNKRLAIKESIAATNSTTLFARASGVMSKAAGVLGRALGFLTGPWGLLLLVIGQVLVATGALSALWEGVFGKSTKTLEEKLASLSKEQKTVNAAMVEMGISAEDAVSQIENNTVSMTELTGGVVTVTNKLTGAITVMKTFGKTKIVTTVQNEELAKLNKHIDALIAKRKELASSKKGFFLGFDFRSLKEENDQKDRQIALDAKIAAANSKKTNLASKTAASALKPFGDFLVPGQAAVSDVATGFGKANVKDPQKKALTRSENIQNSISEIQNLVKNESVIRSTLEKAKQQLLVETAAKNTNNILGIEKFIKSAKKSLQDIKAAPKIIAQFRKDLSKLNKPSKSDKNLLASTVLDEQLRVFKLKKSAQTKDVDSTVAYFDELSAIEAERFKVSSERRLIDLKNSSKSAEEKASVRKKIALEGANEQVRIRAEKSAILMENLKAELKAVAGNESLSWEERLAAQKDFNALTLDNFRGSAEEKAALISKQAKDIDKKRSEEIDKNGNFFQILVNDAEKAAKKASSVSRVLANGFQEAGSIIADTLTNKIGTSLGILTDKAKNAFIDQLAAAQSSYASMVAAANDAFGLDQSSGALNADRALQDLQRRRDRQIADLTAQRDTGAIDQTGFNAGVANINTDFNRGQQDIGINQGRNSEDANKKRQNSLLGAQKKLNKKLLAANKSYAKENGKVWDTMYSGLKGIAFTVLGEIAKAELAKAVSSIAIKFTEETVKTGATAAGATAQGAITEAQGANTTAALTPSVFAQFSAAIPPPFGQIAGGIAVAALLAMQVAAAVKSIVTPSLSLPSTSLPAAPKFHTGGLLTGQQSEVPFVGLTGEGVLNRHNGMRAIGGERALNTANATGTLPVQGGNTTQVTIQFTNNEGDVKDSLTIDNFEDFLRNKGSKQMHNVSQDGYIMLDKLAITGI